MDYTEAVAYIEETPKFTKKNKPENTWELIERIGHPERRMKVIHVAGTNGKGSVCAFLSSILTHAGYRTGLFTSPHLVNITERFQINGEEVSQECFTWAFEEVKRAVDAMIADGYAHPAYFELLFAAGLLIFQREQVEYLVLETGLGGRLDATNLVEHPIATVLTTISLDHMEYLGDTVAKIAGEKAGIIKEGVPTFALHSGDEVDSVLREVAIEKHSPFTFVDTNTDEEIYLKMRGKSARANFILARQVVKSLNLPKKHYPMSERKLENYYNGLLTLPARGEVIIERNSVILLDGAHTKDSVDELVSNIKDIILNVDLDDLRDKYAIHFDYGDIESF